MKRDKKLFVDSSYIFVDSIDIFNGEDEKTEEFIAKQARAIAENNDLKIGDSVNADIFYRGKDGKKVEVISTITYDGESLIVESGYKAKKFDKVYADEELEQI